MYFEKTNKLTLIHYLKSNEFINFKLINRTKKRLIETVSQIILSQSGSWRPSLKLQKIKMLGTAIQLYYKKSKVHDTP